MTDPLESVWSPAQTAVLRRLHAWAVGMDELNQHLATWLGMPASDADALGHVVWAAEEGDPLTPSDLARRIGLTSGATTALLNRLEAAGCVRRSREHADRRRVTLRPEPAAREAARAFLAAAGAEVADVVRTAPEDELLGVIAFLERITGAVGTANHRLRAMPRGPGAATASRSAVV